MTARHWLAAVSLVASAATGVSAYAQDAAPDAGSKDWLAQPASSPPVAFTSKAEGPSTLRIVGLLAIVGGLGGAAVYMKRKRAQVAERHGSPELAVVSTARLGPKSHLVLASVSGRMILLGVSDTNVRKLAWITEKQQEGEKDTEVKPSQREPFSKVLREILDEVPEPAPAAEPAPARTREPAAATEPRRSLLTVDSAARMYSDAAPRKSSPAITLSRPAASAPPEPRSVPTTDLEGQVLGLARARKSRR